MENTTSRTSNSFWNRTGRGQAGIPFLMWLCTCDSLTSQYLSSNAVVPVATAWVPGETYFFPVFFLARPQWCNTPGELPQPCQNMLWCQKEGVKNAFPLPGAWIVFLQFSLSLKIHGPLFSATNCALHNWYTSDIFLPGHEQRQCLQSK